MSFHPTSVGGRLNTLSSRWVSDISKKFVSLGIQNNLPHCRNGAQKRKHGGYHGYGSVEPEDDAPLGRLEGEVVEDRWHREVQRQEPEGADDGVDVPEEREHGG